MLLDATCLTLFSTLEFLSKEMFTGIIGGMTMNEQITMVVVLVLIMIGLFIRQNVGLQGKNIN